jgi:hypothetical protein
MRAFGPLTTRPCRTGTVDRAEIARAWASHLRPSVPACTVPASVCAAGSAGRPSTSWRTSIPLHSWRIRHERA